MKTAKSLSQSINDDDLVKCGKRVNKTNRLVGQNPCAGVYESVIECYVCGPKHLRHSYQLEYSVSLSLPSHKQYSLEDLLSNHFKSEVIQEYTCLRCSILQYMPKAQPREKQFLNSVLSQCCEFDKESLLRTWYHISEEPMAIHFQNRKILKSTKVLKRPKTLVIHIQRSTINQFGDPVLNNQFVPYPELLNFSSKQY